MNKIIINKKWYHRLKYSELYKMIKWKFKILIKKKHHHLIFESHKTIKWKLMKMVNIKNQKLRENLISLKIFKKCNCKICLKNRRLKII